MDTCSSCYSAFFDPGSIPASPVSELLGTAALPSPSEEERIRYALGETQRAIQALEAKINNLNMAIYTLEQRKLELEYFYKSHKQLISAWQRIPWEIWVNIFLECLPLYTRQPGLQKRIRSTRHPFANFHSGTVPFVLLRVCRCWREIAMGTPQLWAYFALTQKVPHYQEKLDRQLSAARHCPLSVALAIPPSIDDSTFFLREDRKNLISLNDPAVINLLSRSANWEHLTLLCFSDEKLQELVPIMNNIPRLRSLRLICDTQWQPPLPYGGYKVFSNAPLLQEVELKIWNSSPLQLHLPWKQLTTLIMDLSNELFPQWHLIVSLGQDLVKLALGVPDEVSSSPERPQIVLPRLRCLEIRTVPAPEDGDVDAMSSILRHLSCPLVQECKLLGSTANSNGIVQRFLSSISGTLTKFDTDSFVPGELPKWLAAAKNTVELTVNDRIGATEILAEVVEGTNSFLVPNLRRLKVNYRNPKHAILDMVRKRFEEYSASPASRVNTRLESVHITLINEAPSPEFISGLQALEDRGLLVVLLGPQRRLPRQLPAMPEEEGYQYVKYI